MPLMVIALQGIVEVGGVSAFIAGYVFDMWWVMLGGDMLMVIDDAVEIADGILTPLFPMFFAAMLAFLFDPWYVGVFWSLAAFKVFGIPAALVKTFRPQYVLSKIKAKKHPLDDVL